MSELSGQDFLVMVLFRVLLAGRERASAYVFAINDQIFLVVPLCEDSVLIFSQEG